MYFDVSAKALTWQELEDIVRSGKAEQYLKEGNAAVVNFIRAQIGFLGKWRHFTTYKAALLGLLIKALAVTCTLLSFSSCLQISICDTLDVWTLDKSL